MSTTGTTIFPNEGMKNYFTLYDEEYTRQFDLGSNWDRLCIGVLCAVETNTSCTGGLWIGLGSSVNGAGAGIKDGMTTLTRMVGCGTGHIGQMAGYGTSYQKYTYTEDVSGSYMAGTGLFQWGVSASSTAGYNAGSTAAHVLASTEVIDGKPRKTAFWASFTRIGTNIGIQCYAHQTAYYTSSNDTNIAISDPALIDAISAPHAPSVTSINGNSSVGTNIKSQTFSATDEGTAPLDTVNVFWTGSAPLRVYQIAVYSS